jgi:hypothetical protein
MILICYGIPFGILAIALAYALALSDLPWHLRHGFHVETNGTRIHIPFSYNADSDLEHGLVARMSPRRASFGTAEPDYGMVSVLFVTPGSLPGLPEGWTQQGAWADRDEHSTADIVEQRFTFAGRNGTCHEYTIRPRNFKGMSFEGNDVGVSCWFGPDVVAHFEGTPRTVDSFYEMIQSAKDVGGKRQSGL